MTTTSTLLSLGVLTGLALAAAPAVDLRPAVVSSPAGTMRIQQPIPCGGMIDLTTKVTAGRLEFTPPEGFDAGVGARSFTVTLATVFFAGFAARGSCRGFDATKTYGDIGVHLVRGVSFTASPTGVPDVYRATIPRDQLIFEYATTIDGSADAAHKIPREDAIATIDLRAGILSLHVVFGTSAHFRAGCVSGACLIDEMHAGTITVDLSGTIAFPDSDRDGVPDRSDNCRFTANPTQAPVSTPTIEAPPDVTLDSCLSRNFGFARSVDGCDATRVTVTHDAPPQFRLGANTILWRAEDGLHRVATDTQTVTIVDTTKPTFTFVPLDLSLDRCGPANLGMPRATDDCEGAVTFTNNAPPTYGAGMTPVTWTATDAAGNQSTMIQKVIVADTGPPTVSCTPTRPPGSSVRVSATDSCAGKPVIRLGSYVLAEGEVIKINETGQPGVRLHNVVGADRIRHFHVGRGQAVITATDESGNVASIACPVPR